MIGEGGNGGLGGGGNGFGPCQRTTPGTMTFNVATDGNENTGGGGGGGTGAGPADPSTSSFPGSSLRPQGKGGDGGSGIVIVKATKAGGAVQIFKSSSTITVPIGATSMDFLVIAGGGAGGTNTGGGGGAGGTRMGAGFPVTEGQTFTVNVGSGGQRVGMPVSGITFGKGGSGSESFVIVPGSPTSFIGSNGGGGGGIGDNHPSAAPDGDGLAGGCGGGAGNYHTNSVFGGTGNTPAITPVTGEVNPGVGQGGAGGGTRGPGGGPIGTIGVATGNASGGGGASAAGSPGGDVGGGSTGGHMPGFYGHGGAGVTNSLTGVTKYYAGGGAGANHQTGSVSSSNPSLNNIPPGGGKSAGGYPADLDPNVGTPATNDLGPLWSGTPFNVPGASAKMGYFGGGNGGFGSPFQAGTGPTRYNHPDRGACPAIANHGGGGGGATPNSGPIDWAEIAGQGGSGVIVLKFNF